MKYTHIDMNCTDTGARITSTMPIPCPVCGTVVTANVEHLCGDMVPNTKKSLSTRKTRRVGKGE